MRDSRPYPEHPFETREAHWGARLRVLLGLRRVAPARAPLDAAITAILTERHDALHERYLDLSRLCGEANALYLAAPSPDAARAAYAARSTSQQAFRDWLDSLAGLDHHFRSVKANARPALPLPATDRQPLQVAS